ncbi:N-acetylglucosamine kinase [Bizionia sediminis]|uniref:N-acetylglucosamine kinase n=1 Tax=Bizionia sediminis TaxID=1737064 RepID=A0ABW5KTC0_9FLAO
MIIIVDSGSTKSDWIIRDPIENNVVCAFQTKGLNPAILSEHELRGIINGAADVQQHRQAITKFFFYGAGCGTENPRLLLSQVLQSIFKKAKIQVLEDTYGAVRAVLNTPREAAVVCILGTGSNCSYFDGKQLFQAVPSLGYSIMDDASGNYFGKQLLRDYYFNRMPKAIQRAFEDAYAPDADTIKNKLYKQPNPNAYLASFAAFMFNYKEDTYIKTMLKNGLRLFSENMIAQFAEEIKSVPVHFVGSISYFAKAEILEIAKEYHFNVGNIVKRPIDGLVAYHSNK